MVYVMNVLLHIVGKEHIELKYVKALKKPDALAHLWEHPKHEWILYISYCNSWVAMLAIIQESAAMLLL